jgi:hypothetical protein
MGPGDAGEGQNRAKQIDGFGRAIPPDSTNPPASDSDHITGKAIGMEIAWTDNMIIKVKDSATESIPSCRMSTPKQTTCHWHVVRSH